MSRWYGIDQNERLVNSVRNALVDIYVWGVRGASPDQGYPQSRMTSREEVERYIDRAIAIYALLVEQTAPRPAKKWLNNRIDELDDLINKAVAVRDGKTQKMTTREYAAYQKSLDIFPD